MDTKTKTLPSHDYGQALQSAVEWLGDRYLLATPQPKREDIHPVYLKELPPRRAARRVALRTTH